MRTRIHWRRGVAAIGVLALASTGCPTGRRVPIEQNAEAIRQAVAAEASRQDTAAGKPAAGEGVGVSEAGFGPADAAGAGPPRSEAEREARVRAALGPAGTLRQVVAVAPGSHLSFALVRSERASTREPVSRLVLLDASTDPARPVAEHVFQGASLESPAPPDRIARPLGLGAADKSPLALAALAVDEREDAAGGPVVAACGWWLRRAGATFVCAPKMSFPSDFAASGQLLIESWATALPGDVSGEPPRGGRSGRVSRFVERRWREVGRFRCLRREPESVLDEVDPAGLEAWQRSSVLRLMRSSREFANRLETAEAIGRLDDALSIDACDADVWRALGRLRFESGRGAEAAAALALSLAMEPPEAASLVALADALEVIDTASDPGARSWQRVQTTLADRPATRRLLETAAARGRGPRALALTLYEEWLERTDPDQVALAAGRRRVERIVTERGGRLPAPRETPASSPVTAATPGRRSRAVAAPAGSR